MESYPMYNNSIREISTLKELISEAECENNNNDNVFNSNNTTTAYNNFENNNDNITNIYVCGGTSLSVVKRSVTDVGSHYEENVDEEGVVKRSSAENPDDLLKILSKTRNSSRIYDVDIKNDRYEDDDDNDLGDDSNFRFVEEEQLIMQNINDIHKTNVQVPNAAIEDNIEGNNNRYDDDNSHRFNDDGNEVAPPLPQFPPPVLFDDCDFSALDDDNDNDHINNLSNVEDDNNNNVLIYNNCTDGADECLIQFLDHVSERAESKLVAQRQARAEAREIRMRELERQQKSDDENEVYDMYNSDVGMKSSRIAPCSANGKNASIVYSPGRNNSRRSSEDSLEENLNYRDMKLELKEAEEKFRKSMIQNAQLDNEKSAMTYSVELYKDKYQDLEETYSLLQLEHKEKCRDHEQLKRSVTKQTEELEYYKFELAERDKLIEEQGLVIVTVNTNINCHDSVNGDEESVSFNNVEHPQTYKRVLVFAQSDDLLNSTAPEESLDVKLKRFAKERKEHTEEISRLKLELDEERRKFRSVHNSNIVNGSDGEEFDDAQKGTNRLAGDNKFRLQKAEQDISTLQANVVRLESQVIRYKSAAETSEKIEDELKVEKRKLQRELREAQSRVEELETSSMHLQRRLDKLKNAKSAILKEI